MVRNMEASREIPTATSYRSIAVKALEENRRFLNHHLDLASGGKISFTHVIAWAVIRALAEHPNLNSGFAVVRGEPHRLRRPRIHLGVAVDLERKDGTRTLLVPNLKDVRVHGLPAVPRELQPDHRARAFREAPARRTSWGPR